MNDPRQLSIMNSCTDQTYMSFMRIQKWLLCISLGVAALSASGQAIDQAKIYSELRSGNRQRLEKLLAEGVNPNHRDAEGNTLLMQAAIYGGVDAMALLVERGADVNASNAAGATVLMRAATDAQKVRLLLERGAEVNTRSALGNTPLMLAARANGNSESVALLLKYGADINATNVFGAKAITAAAASGDTESVRLLLKKGANPNVRLRGDLDAVLWGGGRTPLMWASYRGDLATMKQLLEAGAEVNMPEGLGSALTQAAWADKTEAARLLLDRGADVNQKEFMSGFTALHWAASTEKSDSSLVKLLLDRGANVNATGGESVDAYLGTPQTPLMLAEKRGETEIVRMLRAAGATGTKSQTKCSTIPQRDVPSPVTYEAVQGALNRSVSALRDTALESKDTFLRHASKQNCVSCHQQYLPMAAFALTRNVAPVPQADEQRLIEMVLADNKNLAELTAQTTFHPEPAHGYGYALLGLGLQNQPPDSHIDAQVQHLMIIQGKDGQWYNNLQRPPIQSSDVSATAFGIYALNKYGFPGRESETRERIARAQKWLWHAKPATTEERALQLMGLSWAGVSTKKLQHLVSAIVKEQREDGGWAQLPKRTSDAYATGQALYALHLAGVSSSSPEFEKGVRFLLGTQFDDGSWLVERRAFPFQPTMKSGFPQGRDSWVSASGTSWASMALAVSIDKPAGQARAFVKGPGR